MYNLCHNQDTEQFHDSRNFPHVSLVVKLWPHSASDKHWLVLHPIDLLLREFHINGIIQDTTSIDTTPPSIDWLLSIFEIYPCCSPLYGCITVCFAFTCEEYLGLYYFPKGCCNKILITRWLKTTEINFLTVPEARVLNESLFRAMIPLRPVGGAGWEVERFLLCLFLASACCQWPLTFFDL